MQYYIDLITAAMEKEQSKTNEPSEVGCCELLAKISEQERLLDLYREMVGRMALADNKNQSWTLMKFWWDNKKLQTIGHDLKTADEQKAFLFG